MVDDRTSYVLTVVKGPVKVNTDELTFLSRALTERWQPDFKLEKQASDACLIEDYTGELGRLMPLPTLFERSDTRYPN